MPPTWHMWSRLLGTTGDPSAPTCITTLQRCLCSHLTVVPPNSRKLCRVCWALRFNHMLRSRSPSVAEPFCRPSVAATVQESPCLQLPWACSRLIPTLSLPLLHPLSCPSSLSLPPSRPIPAPSLPPPLPSFSLPSPPSQLLPITCIPGGSRAATIRATATPRTSGQSSQSASPLPT